jgi:hypothetical protein
MDDRGVGAPGHLGSVDAGREFDDPERAGGDVEHGEFGDELAAPPSFRSAAGGALAEEPRRAVLGVLHHDDDPLGAMNEVDRATHATRTPVVLPLHPYPLSSRLHRRNRYAHG